MSATQLGLTQDWYLHEKLLTFAQLARRISSPHKGDHSINPSTIWRWFKRGCLSKRGLRVHLEACRIGGVNFSSEERFRDFVERLNDDDDYDVPPANVGAPLSPRSPNSPGKVQLAKERQSREAMQVLKARGVVD